MQRQGLSRFSRIRVKICKKEIEVKKRRKNLDKYGSHKDSESRSPKANFLQKKEFAKFFRQLLVPTNEMTVLDWVSEFNENTLTLCGQN